ncbi:DUF397 domain-containing protein [Streptomyces beigongshangae]|uniref:DUF397 domain-containing protein n=1 Tax=Streptomyces beigongshangae TaxID=2841597 RepID=UPI001C846D70|nr:DUF397 domain-containing protein [Streptomyces sp. REN17]
MTAPDNWQRSSFSGGADGNNCVELASTSYSIHLRESDTPSTELVTTPTPLTHLLHGIRSGALKGT